MSGCLSAPSHSSVDQRRPWPTASSPSSNVIPSTAAISPNRLTTSIARIAAVAAIVADTDEEADNEALTDGEQARESRARLLTVSGASAPVNALTLTASGERVAVDKLDARDTGAYVGSIAGTPETVTRKLLELRDLGRFVILVENEPVVRAFGERQREFDSSDRTAVRPLARHDGGRHRLELEAAAADRAGHGSRRRRRRGSGRRGAGESGEGRGKDEETHCKHSRGVTAIIRPVERELNSTSAYQRHPGLDPGSMNTILSERGAGLRFHPDEAVFMDPDFRQDDVELQLRHCAKAWEE